MSESGQPHPIKVFNLDAGNGRFSITMLADYTFQYLIAKDGVAEGLEVPPVELFRMSEALNSWCHAYPDAIKKNILRSRAKDLGSAVMRYIADSEKRFGNLPMSADERLGMFVVSLYDAISAATVTLDRESK